MGLTLIPTNKTDAPGSWRCTCGLAYRFAARGDGIVYWPALGAHAFRPQPVEGTCIGCGRDLPGGLPPAA